MIRSPFGWTLLTKSKNKVNLFENCMHFVEITANGKITSSSGDTANYYNVANILLFLTNYFIFDMGNEQ